MKPRPWLLVALLCGTATASYLCRVNITVTGALLMRDFGLSQIQMGWVFSAFLLGYSLFQIPAGMLADRWGARRILALSAWWWFAATILQALVGWGPFATGATAALATLLVLRFVLGVGEAPTFPGAARGVSRWIPPQEQGRANGVVIAAIALGSALAPPLFSSIMVRWGWRAALIVSSIPALAVALTWLRIQEPDAIRILDPGTPPESKENRRGRPLRTRSFILLSASYTLQGYVGYIFVFWFYLYLVQERHFDLLRGAVLSSLPWILSIVSIPLGGYLSDRIAAGRAGLTWGRRIVPLLALILAGILLALGAHTGSPYAAAVYLALSTALVLAVEGPFWATMMEIAGESSGTAGGIMNMGCNIGGLISPALTPVLAATLGWDNALFLAAGISVVAGALWLGIGLEKPARQ